MQWLPTYLARNLGAGKHDIMFTAVPYIMNSLIGVGKFSKLKLLDIMISERYLNPILTVVKKCMIVNRSRVVVKVILYSGPFEKDNYDFVYNWTQEPVKEKLYL